MLAKHPMAVAVALLCLLGARLHAGTTGKITGRVLDEHGQPVAGATIEIEGQPMAGFTDDDGRYTILNVPPGTYSVTIHRVGFHPFIMRDVIISADETSRVDGSLVDATPSTDAVVVHAQPLPVEVNLTSSRVSLSTEEIERLPVQELQDIVNLQAGVVDGHFRGGRKNEVQYQVDGLTINDPYDNTPSLRIDRSLLQEVQVVSGTFDAEYGQAMSGVVNAVLKQGTQNFQWSAEFLNGGFLFADAENRRRTTDGFQPAAVQNYQLTLSGPTGLPQTVYFLSGRHYTFDDYVVASRLFEPTPTIDDSTNTVVPTGDGEELALGYTREWSGAAKLTNSSMASVQLNYQALFNYAERRPTNNQFVYNPDGLSEPMSLSLQHGLDWTHTLGRSTFYSVSFRQNYTDYDDRVYEDVYDPRYDAAGPPTPAVNEPGVPDFIVSGVQFNRFEQKTNSYLVKSTVVTQVTHTHQLKFGLEAQRSTVSFGVPGHLVFTGGRVGETLTRHEDEPPDYPGVRTYVPLLGAAFAQDQIELLDLTVRAGLRFDYFDARSTLPSDLANPANSIEGAPESVPVPTSKKYSLSPRLGVSYPVTDRGALHFAYGHFSQFPPLGQIFANADFNVLGSLQAGGISYGVLGNPDIEPEKTVQYEFGYKQAFSQHFGLDATMFYKDIRDLLGVAFISTYNNAEYAILTNADIGTVIGLTLAADHQRLGPLSVALDYTWQLARGNASDPRETATRAAAGEDPRPRVIPLDWDQRHTLNLTTTLSSPGTYTVSAVLRAASGQPYSPTTEAAFGFGLEANSGRKPASWLVDLRAERRIRSVPGLGLFLRVFNLFDTRFFNGAVFTTTGSPYYSRSPTADILALNDPTFYYPPRRIELGVNFSSGQRSEAGGP